MTDQLLTSFEREGLWWTLAESQQRLAGTLRYHPFNGCTLDVLGQLRTTQEAWAHPSQGPSVIHGITKDGRKVTLFQNLPKTFSLRAPGLSTETYFPQFAFIGELIDCPASFAARRCEFTLTNLEEWLGHRPFKLHHTGGDRPELKVTLRLPEPERFVLPHASAILESTASYQTHGGGIREFRVEAPSWFILETKHPRTLQQHLGVIARLRNLMALCLGEPSYISSIILRNEGRESDSQNGGDLRIECLFRQNPKPIPPYVRELRSFISIVDFGASAGSVLNNWLILYDEIQPSLDILFAVLHSEMYLDVRFLLAAQAAEVLHRRLWSGTYVDDTHYRDIERRLIAAIPNDISPDFQKKLKGILRYGNELSLRRRLKELIQSIAETANIRHLDSPFINAVVDTRNYLTHYDRSSERNAKEGQELHDLYAKIILMISIVIFMKLNATTHLVWRKLMDHPLFGKYLEG